MTRQRHPPAAPAVPANKSWRNSDISMTPLQLRGLDRHARMHRLLETVTGILSRDSLIMKFDASQDYPPIHMILIEHLIAPKFGSPDWQIPDELFNFES
jgi:hypothetical protein